MTSAKDFTELDLVVYILVGLYGILVLFPIIQLLRIFIRVPEIGWTTQKLFLFLTLLSCAVRCVFFAVVPVMHGTFFMVNFAQHPLFTILDTLPSMLFFSTYTLLVLFWAEIIHHARNQSLSFPMKLRPIFLVLNIICYLVLISFWLFLFFLYQYRHSIDIAVNVYLSLVYLLAAAGFILYGGRLYRMLKVFPIESRGRTSKLKEVGWVTIICTSCFTLRAVLLLVGTVNENMDTNNWFIGGYYLISEVVPSLLVLYILRKIPPKRGQTAEVVATPYTRIDASQFDRYDSENYEVRV